jgi:hypothetical protein
VDAGRVRSVILGKTRARTVAVLPLAARGAGTVVMDIISIDVVSATLQVHPAVVVLATYAHLFSI